MGTYSTTGTTASFQWLQPDTAHTFTVRAFNAAGTPSAPSAPHTTRTAKDTTAPSTPVPTGSATSPSSLHLSWPASTDDANAVSYNVDLDGRPWKHMLPTSPTAIDVLNLRDGTTYDLTVRAYDGSGNFSAPAHLTLTTPDELRRHATTGPDRPRRPLGHAAHRRPQVGTVVRASRTPSRTRSTWTARSCKKWSATGATAGCSSPAGRSATCSPAPRTRSRCTTATRPGTSRAHPTRSRSRSRRAATPHRPRRRPSLTGDTSPNCAFAFFTWTGGGGEPGDVEIYEDGHFLDVWRDEAFMTSFGRHDYTVRYVDSAGNTSAPSPPVTLDHGMRC